MVATTSDPIGFIHSREEDIQRLRRVDHLSTGVQDQPGQHSETPVSTKNKKLAMWLRAVVHACNPSTLGV